MNILRVILGLFHETGIKQPAIYSHLSLVKHASVLKLEGILCLARCYERPGIAAVRGLPIPLHIAHDGDAIAGYVPLLLPPTASHLRQSLR